MSVSLPVGSLRHPVPTPGHDAHGVTTVPAGAGVGDAAHLVDEAGRRFHDLGIEPEILRGVDVGHPEAAAEALRGDRIAESLEVCGLSLVITCQRGDLMEGRRPTPAPFGEDARRIA